MAKTKFNIWISAKKVIQTFCVFIIPQIGNILATVTITDGSILDFIRTLFPAVSVPIATTISALVIGLINAWKHKNDGK